MLQKKRHFLLTFLKSQRIIMLVVDIIETEMIISMGTVFDVKTLAKSKTELEQIKMASGYYITANKNYVRKTK